MIKKIFVILSAVSLIAALSACANATEPLSPQTQESLSSQIQEPASKQTDMPLPPEENTEDSPMNAETQNALGAMSPEEALEYMKKTGNLVIVDVAATRWYDEKHFEGAVNIPIEELDSEAEDDLYMNIPADRPVLMHCRRGMIVPGAYERVLELRPDIPEISYIDGVPPFDKYNEWIENQ